MLGGTVGVGSVRWGHVGAPFLLPGPRLVSVSFHRGHFGALFLLIGATLGSVPSHRGHFLLGATFCSGPLFARGHFWSLFLFIGATLGLCFF